MPQRKNGFITQNPWCGSTCAVEYKICVCTDCQAERANRSEIPNPARTYLHSCIVTDEAAGSAVVGPAPAGITRINAVGLLRPVTSLNGCTATNGSPDLPHSVPQFKNKPGNQILRKILLLRIILTNVASSFESEVRCNICTGSEKLHLQFTVSGCCYDFLQFKYAV